MISLLWQIMIVASFAAFTVGLALGIFRSEWQTEKSVRWAAAPLPLIGSSCSLALLAVYLESGDGGAFVLAVWGLVISVFAYLVGLLFSFVGILAYRRIFQK